MRTLVATEMMIMVMGMSGRKRKFDFLPSLLFFLFRPSPLSSCQAFPDPVSPFPSCHSMVATTLPVPPLVLPYTTLPPPYSTCHSATVAVTALAQCLCPSSFHLDRCPSLIAVSPGPRAPDTRNTNSQRFTACSKYTNSSPTMGAKLYIHVVHKLSNSW